MANLVCRLSFAFLCLYQICLTTSQSINLLCEPTSNDLTRISGKDGSVNGDACTVTFKGGKGVLVFPEDYAPPQGYKYTIEGRLIFDYPCDEESRKCDAGVRFLQSDEETFYQFSFRKLSIGENLNEPNKNRLVLKYGNTIVFVSDKVYWIAKDIGYYVRIFINYDNTFSIYVRSEFDGVDGWQDVFGQVNSRISQGDIGITATNAYVRFTQFSVDVEVPEDKKLDGLLSLSGDLGSSNEYSIDYKIYGAACLIVLFGIFGIIRLVRYCSKNGNDYKEIDAINDGNSANCDYQTMTRV